MPDVRASLRVNGQKLRIGGKEATTLIAQPEKKRFVPGEERSAKVVVVSGGVCGADLREIREAREVSDLGRLLRKYKGGRNELKEAEFKIRCVNADEIYREFYGNRYEALKKINNRKN